MTLHDVMDDAADLAMAGRRLDPAQFLGQEDGTRFPAGNQRAAGWVRAVLVAAVVVGLLLVLLPVLHRGGPAPAAPPTGPGAVPRSLYLPPVWTPSVTEKPISRAVYVATSVWGEGAEQTPPDGLWLVGADHGEYRTLPAPGGVTGTALSADGRYVAWAQDGDFGAGSQVRIVDVRTGQVRSVELPGSRRRGLRVGALAFDRTGARLALQGWDAAGPSPRSTVAVIDVRTGVVRSVCLTVGSRPGVAFGPDGVLLTSCPAIAMAGRWLPVEQLPRAAGEPVPEGGPAPNGMPSDRALVADGGQRWTVAGKERPASPAVLLGPGLPAAGVDLGRSSGAEGLAVTGRGVAVTRWTGTSTDGLLGPSDVVLVPVNGPDRGQVSVLSAGVGNQVRAVAVAADVVSGGVRTDGVRPGHRLLDPQLYRWGAGLAAAWLAIPSRWPGWVWLIVVLGAAGCCFRYQVTRQRAASRQEAESPSPPLPAPGRFRAGSSTAQPLLRLLRSRPVRAAGAVAGVLLVAASAGLLLLPAEAGPAPRPPGSGPAATVVPRALVEEIRRPPLAFDRAGHPRTAAVSMIFMALEGSRSVIDGVDAATGTLVRLQDLPGTAYVEGASFTWPDNLTVSPNGRFLTNGDLVVDLRTARVTPIPDVVPANWTGSDTFAGSTAVLDDGSVVLASQGGKQLWHYPPPGSGRPGKAVPGVSDVESVEVQPDERILVTHFTSRPAVEAIDLAGPAPHRIGLPGPAQQELLSVGSGIMLRLTGDGTIEQRRPDDPGRARPGTALDPPGGIDALMLAGPAGRRPTLVALGAGARTPLAVLRAPLDVTAGTSGPVAELTRLDLKLLSPWSGSEAAYAAGRIRLAPEVIAAATVVDVPAEPWWARLSTDRWRVAAGLVLGAAALAAVARLDRARRRRAVRARAGS